MRKRPSTEGLHADSENKTFVHHVLPCGYVSWLYTPPRGSSLYIEQPKIELYSHDGSTTFCMPLEEWKEEA